MSYHAERAKERREQIRACPSHYPVLDSVVDDDTDGERTQYVATCRECDGLIRTDYTREDPANADWHMPDAWLPGA